MSLFNRRRRSNDALAHFAEQLATLLESGFPLLPSLQILSDQKVWDQEEAERVCKLLDEGKSLSEALNRERFPPIFVSFVRAAEEHGDYAFGLRQCVIYYRERGKLIREMGQAVLYPAIVLLLVMGAFLFLVTVVIPRFTELYEAMDLELPRLTQVLIAVYDSLRRIFIYLGLLVAILALFTLILFRLPSEKRNRWLGPLYRLPIIRYYYALRFTHYLSVQLGSLLRSGLPLMKALEIMRSLTPWYRLSAGIERIQARLLAGHSLHYSLAVEKGGLFLSSLPPIVAIGEESGRLDQSLLILGEGTERMIRERAHQLTRSLEPILIFFIGVLIAITVIAMFLPMLNLVRAL